MRAERPWHAHYPEEVLPAYPFPTGNVAQLLLNAAENMPKQIAIRFFDSKMTYESLRDEAYRFANALQEQFDLQKGDRVAIMLPNCPQLVIAYFGTLLAGGTVVMTNPLYQEEELAYQVKDAESVILVTLDLLLPRVLPVQAHLGKQSIIYTSIKEYLPFPKNKLYPLKMKKEGHSLHIPKQSGLQGLQHLLYSTSPKRCVVQVDDAQDLALIQYTGGTTGLPKGVMLTHANLLANTIQTTTWSYKLQYGQESYMGVIPCFHVFGLTVLLNQCTHMAGTLILMPRFDPDEVLGHIQKYRPTIFPGVPTMYMALSHHSRIHDVDLSSIEVCISGSAPLPLEVQQRFEALTGGRLTEGYGLTETAPVTHVNPIWGKRKSGSIGIPLPNTDCYVVHPDTRKPCSRGEVGELAVKGPQVMKGYWKRPVETAQVLQDGWLYTGDLATMDEDGYFTIVDRKKEMIISSGFNVYPREVEEVLYRHPGIKEAAVIGIPDAYRGETVKAFIVPRENTSVHESQLDEWCRQRLAAYKVPRHYEFRDQLPKTIIGKVLKRALIEKQMEQKSTHKSEDTNRDGS
ncbi:long-chain-fatty-acid--CoA ligase [Marinicrinis sediminis]|uniref:Long-chain fatty acid--CoA ligase n=1 Tax=Marinicrinis sediminis TaxID=1652465 RepID=A0ABW5RDK7_9BACL